MKLETVWLVYPEARFYNSYDEVVKVFALEEEAINYVNDFNELFDTDESFIVEYKLRCSKEVQVKL